MEVTTRYEWWRPTEGMLRPLAALLAVQAAGNLALVFVDDGKSLARFHGVVEAWIDGNDTLARERLSHVGATGTQRALTQVLGYVAIAALVLLILWAWRSAKNALALRRTGARLSPGWTIAGFLIPIAWYVMPYLTFSDLWRSSGPTAARGEAWRRMRPSPLVAGWLFARIAAAVLFGVATGLLVSGSVTAADARPLLVVAHLVTAMSAGLLVPIVVVITRRQAAQQAVDPAAERRGNVGTPAVVLGPDGIPVPGWYSDPRGAYDHRYWDGRGWTEHVSRGGVATIAPVVAPDWYPDPSGRHGWRFWGGTGWTDHVANDGVMSEDPFDGPAGGPSPALPS